MQGVSDNAERNTQECTRCVQPDSEERRGEGMRGDERGGEQRRGGEHRRGGEERGGEKSRNKIGRVTSSK